MRKTLYIESQAPIEKFCGSDLIRGREIIKR